MLVGSGDAPVLSVCCLLLMAPLTYSCPALPLVGSCVQLKKIDLSGGCLEHLQPEVLVGLEKNKELRDLDLSNNRIKVIPEAMADMFMLHELNLTNNPIDKWPPRVPNMQVRSRFHHLCAQLHHLCPARVCAPEGRSSRVGARHLAPLIICTPSRTPGHPCLRCRT